MLDHQWLAQMTLLHHRTPMYIRQWRNSDQKLQITSALATTTVRSYGNNRCSLPCVGVTMATTITAAAVSCTTLAILMVCPFIIVRSVNCAQQVPLTASVKNILD